MESAPPLTPSSEAPPPAEAAPPQQPETTAPSIAGPSPPATSSAPSTSTVVDAPAASSGSPSQNPPPPQPHLHSQQPIQPSPRLASRPPTPFTHVAHQLPSPSSASQPAISAASSRPLAPSLPSPSTPSSTTPRSGGLAIGVPAHGPHFSRPQQPSMSFSPFGPSRAFSQPFSSLPRVPDQSPTANAQGRPPIQSIQHIGMIGSLSTSSQMRPTGPSGPQQQRFGQPTLRSTSTSASHNSQNFPGSTLLGGPSMVSPSSSAAAQQISAQGKQNIPTASSSSYRPQVRPHVLQTRPNQIQQHQHSLSTTSHQPQTPSLQQQHQQQKSHQPFQLQQQLQQQQQQQQVQNHQVSVHQLQEQNPSQQNISLRNQQSLAHQQPHRPLGPIANRPNAPALVQSGAAQSGPVVPAVNADVAESGNRVISKRSIHELVNQIDPSEKLDDNVEEVLMDIAEDFIESVTSFACSLAKHRKSSILESKDILLHVEKCWNMTLPGYGGDEIKSFKKQMTNDIHKERLAMIKKSMLATGDTGNTRNPAAGQSAANSKAHAQPKAPLIGSPKT